MLKDFDRSGKEGFLLDSDKMVYDDAHDEIFLSRIYGFGSL
jgi:hypothetical protein